MALFGLCVASSMQSILRGCAQNVLTPLGLRPLCCTLRMLSTLEGPAPDYVAKHTSALVKLLVRLAKEHAQGNPSLILAPLPPQPGQPPRCACPRFLHRSCFNLQSWLGSSQTASYDFKLFLAAFMGTGVLSIWLSGHN